MRGDVTDAGQPNDDDDKQLKIELLSQWKLEAESLPPAPQVWVALSLKLSLIEAPSPPAPHISSAMTFATRKTRYEKGFLGP